VGLQFETWSAETPWIESVWTCRSPGVTEMTSVATETVGLVFWTQDGRAHVSLTGPERGARTAPVPEGAEFLGIQLGVGVSLRCAATPGLVDGGIALPDVTPRRFRLGGRSWSTPRPEDAEALVLRLVADGAVVRDPLVADALRGVGDTVSDRTLQRRFRAATGLTPGAVRQVRRAREAAMLLASGEAVAEVVHALGFYDEPHLARALRRHVGRTAGQLREGTGGALGLDTAPRSTS
jgi:hypothetical protein